MSEIEVTGHLLPCKTCAAPLVLGAPPVGPVTVSTDGAGQTWITPHAADCQRDEPTSPSGPVFSASFTVEAPISPAVLDLYYGRP